MDSIEHDFSLTISIYTNIDYQLTQWNNVNVGLGSFSDDVLR